MLKMNDDIGDKFQQETKYERDKIFGSPDWDAMPEPYKSYPASHIIELPNPDCGGELTFRELLKLRKSIRHYSKEPLSVHQLSFLLWASFGPQRHERGRLYRTAPSAGALYPIETYLIVNRVTGIESGVYHYNITKHALEEVRLGDFSFTIAEAALGQYMCAECAVVFAWTAIFQRCKWKYKQRAYRYIYLDAGHIAQNLALAAVSLNIGTCQIGALFDDEVNSILDVDGVKESIIYMSCVGFPAR